jgi:multidrug efflux pump subunit AcrA (membrane-fusion protein)
MKPIITSHHVLAAAIAASLLTTSALTGCSSRPAEAASADGAEPFVVSTARVSIADVASVVESGGVVQARTAAAIAARILAPVREVRVSPGDHVRRGQTLIVLADDDLAAAVRAAGSAAVAAEQGSNAAAAELRAAEAAFALACASYDRIVGLHRRRSATAQELDEATEMRRSAEARVAGAEARALQARSAVESARAAADQANATESFTRIPAPFDGTITERLIEPGNMASPAVPLLRLENPRGFRLDVRVDESRLGQIRRGDSIPVALGPENSLVAGAVDEVSRAVDADARAFLVKIALPDVPGLRSGQFGKARFRGEPRRALTIPSPAIVHRGQLTSVFVVENGRARVRLVNVRESEVMAGLAESELVILSPPAGLTDGRRVRVGGR